MLVLVVLLQINLFGQFEQNRLVAAVTMATKVLVVKMISTMVQMDIVTIQQNSSQEEEGAMCFIGWVGLLHQEDITMKVSLGVQCIGMVVAIKEAAVRAVVAAIVGRVITAVVALLLEAVITVIAGGIVAIAVGIKQKYMKRIMMMQEVDQMIRKMVS